MFDRNIKNAFKQIFFTFTLISVFLVVPAESSNRRYKDYGTNMENAIIKFLLPAMKAHKVKQAEIKVKEYAKIILGAAKKRNVNPFIVASIIKIESSGRENVISKGCVGLMQVKWSVHKKWVPSSFSHIRTIKDLKHPVNNIEVGVSILGDAIKRSPSLKETVRKYKGGYSSKYLSDVKKYVEQMEKYAKNL